MELAYRRITPEAGHAAGRALLAQMVRAKTGLAPPQIGIAPHGKPYFVSGDLHFSISHTPRHVFCALSDRPVGIDAEEADRKIDLRLAQRILSEMELAQFRAAEDPRKALLTFWVLKEARSKLTGRGLTYPPNATRFSLNDPRVCQIDGCLVAVLEEEAYAV